MMDNKRIILFIDSLGTGGAQRQIVNLAIGLKNKQLNPILVFYNNQNYFQELLINSNIEVVYLNRTNIFDFQFFFNLLKLIKKEKTEWVISFLFMPSFYSLLLKLFSPSLKIIVSERSFEQKTKLFEKIFPRGLYFLSTYITANSITQTNVLLNKFPKYFNRIKYIPNGAMEQSLIYKFDNLIFTIVSIGRVSELKNTKLLIEAVAKLKKTNNSLDIKVLWIGAKYNDNELDMSYYNECVELIQFHNLHKIWEWIGQTSNVKYFLCKATILVHMSTGEGFPNAICESMSLGIPVIASKVMDHPSIIINKFNGYLVESGDLSGLVDALSEYAFLNIEDRKLISQNVFDTAKKVFSLDNMVNNYYNLLTSKS